MTEVLKRWAWWEPTDGSKSATMWNSDCLRHAVQEPGCQILLPAWSSPQPAAASLPRRQSAATEQCPETHHRSLCLGCGKGFTERCEVGLVSCFLPSSTFFCLLSSSPFYWSLFSNTRTRILATEKLRALGEASLAVHTAPPDARGPSLHTDACCKGSRRPAENGETIYSKLGYQVILGYREFEKPHSDFSRPSLDFPMVFESSSSRHRLPWA